MPTVTVNAQNKLDGKILKIDFQNGVSERRSSNIYLSSQGISISSSISLLSVERAIAHAATDKKIALILLNTDGLQVNGIASLEELRKSLEQFKSSGKKVISYSTSYSNASYYLASVADMAVFNPAGTVTISGLSSTTYYVKDLLDTAGVQVQLIRHGKYKSASETYISNEMSSENRQQTEIMLGSIWESMCAEISASRNLVSGKFSSLVDSLALSNAEDMLANNLVDTLMYRDGIENWLCSTFGVEKPTSIPKVSLSEYISGLKKGPASKKIAVIFADGEIREDGPVGIKFSQQIAEAKADSTVKAVVFRINSPGGTVSVSEFISREIETMRKVKPVVASYGNYAASGGYWISCDADRIFTDNSTITGSIGVFSLVLNVGNAIKENLYINPVTVSTNKHGSMYSGLRNLDNDEKEYEGRIVDNYYSKFISRVASCRGMSKEAVDSLGQGRVWTGVNAIGNGLADERGTVLDAIRYAASLVNLDKYRIVYYPIKKSGLSALFDVPESPLVMARMPYDIDIK